jgi:hypothetical protein
VVLDLVAITIMDRRAGKPHVLDNWSARLIVSV